MARKSLGNPKSTADVAHPNFSYDRCTKRCR